MCPYCHLPCVDPKGRCVVFWANLRTLFILEAFMLAWFLWSFQDSSMLFRRVLGSWWNQAYFLCSKCYKAPFWTREDGVQEKKKRARGGVRGVVCTLSSQGFLSYLKKDTGALGGVGVEREGKGFLSLGACASIIAIILWTPRTLSRPPHLPQGPEFSFALPSTLNWTPHQNTRAVGWGVWCLPLWGPHFSWHLLLAKSTYSIIFFCIFLTLPDFWHSILPQIFIYSPSLQHETSKPVFLIH